MTTFTRDGDKITTKPTVVDDESRDHFLEPIREVWRRTVAKRLGK